MSKKEAILNRYRANIHQKFDMPQLDDMAGVTYSNPLEQFISMSQNVGGTVIEVAQDEDINKKIRQLFPDATEIASNLSEINIATKNPDSVENVQELNGIDVGIIRGEFGVAENGCIWVPQTMKEKAICFISEHLLILLSRRQIVNNMHEAYKRITFNEYGYGTFISGPSKTADIAQVLVMGAQAARSITILLLP